MIETMAHSFSLSEMSLGMEEVTILKIVLGGDLWIMIPLTKRLGSVRVNV